MIDPVTALGVATTAFNAIKTGFQAGRDVEGMAGDLSRWMGAVSDIKKAEELNQKPPLFKKLFAAGSVEEEALQTLMAKKKTEDMRDQLKNIIMFSRGHGAWEELLRTEADIRKKRQKAIYDREERIRIIRTRRRPHPFSTNANRIRDNSSDVLTSCLLYTSPSPRDS